VIAASGALLTPPVWAQARVPKLGILNPHPKAPPTADDPVMTGLRRHGWKPGETLIIERPDGGGREDRLPELARQLVAKKVDVIWALGSEAAVAAARTTDSIPIVFWGAAYPVEQGLVDSYARPGRNVTGITWSAGPEVDAKRLEMLRQLAPGKKRLAALSVPTAIHTVNGERAEVQPVIPAAAGSLGYELRAFPIKGADELAPAFAAILAWGAQALTVTPSTITVRERARIVEFANLNRLPSAYALRDFVEAGGLVSYAIDWRPTMARSMAYVDRILRGAKPAELPVEQPSSYETWINLKTAKLLGLAVPQSLLLRADRVIE